MVRFNVCLETVLKKALLLCVFFILNAYADDIYLQFSGSQNPRVSYGFASGDTGEALDMVSAVNYRSVYGIAKLKQIQSNNIQQDSISSLLSEKDGNNLISCHYGTVCQCFAFNMEQVFSQLGQDSIVKTTFKWNGKIVSDTGGSFTAGFWLPQPGHLFRYFSVEDSLSLDMVDTGFANTRWFVPGNYFFFEKELVVQIIIQTKTQDIHAIYTDFMEIEFGTSAGTNIYQKSYQPKSVPLVRYFKSPNGERVRLSVSHSSSFALNIYKLSGVLVETVNCGFLEKGTHTILMDSGQRYPNGSYILALSENGKVISKIQLQHY
jgi:hypothetical protein